MAIKPPSSAREAAERTAIAAQMNYASWDAFVEAMTRAATEAESGDDADSAEHYRALVDMAVTQALRKAEQPLVKSVPEQPGEDDGVVIPAARLPRRTNPDTPPQLDYRKDERLKRLVRDSRAAYDQMTPEQQAAYWARLDAEDAAEKATAHAAYLRRRYEEARPEAFADAAYGVLRDQQDPDAKTSMWLSSGHKNALIMGPSGHGKSYAAYAITNDAIEHGVWVEAWYVPDLVQALGAPDAHARYDETRSARREKLEGYLQDCPLLLLDDLGPEISSGFRASEWVAQLTTILNHRDTNPRARTIVVSNAETKQDATVGLERYGARVLTRIQNDCVGIWIEGECFRQQATWDPF
ncbi:ATP-binding protein [Actinomadura yumaensis]|uniref:ATP-binding protein n=1 Tax=Actinomadura yumaensis TaxID=111807 RepID=A0ABW2CS05_9ACTN